MHSTIFCDGLFNQLERYPINQCWTHSSISGIEIPHPSSPLVLPTHSPLSDHLHTNNFHPHCYFLYSLVSRFCSQFWASSPDFQPTVVYLYTGGYRTCSPHTKHSRSATCPSDQRDPPQSARRTPLLPSRWDRLDSRIMGFIRIGIHLIPQSYSNFSRSLKLSQRPNTASQAFRSMYLLSYDSSPQLFPRCWELLNRLSGIDWQLVPHSV
jgi:hypothetical protein